ncbi:DNA topoisomerase III [Arsukibacterium ikkense]|uniref:DNA topoisomerase 3 n=1 Tax=Arsukibacterium ikkense TaxID=336831 RepID=A0A0M2V559_9GAMM|nr:DNA topoisomerase III [Arsukibacterium ikkense]KKO45997.1 DNA topoisomerase III [Arsukibacterium ikkense]
MILYIAEKPSMGRAIAAAFPKPQSRENGCIRLANGDVISWCIGHLLEQAEPQDYNPDYKRWQANHLPIIPEQWQLKIRKSAQAQLTILQKLIKQADELVHAGDPDREGQLLVDEVIAWSNITAAKRNAVKRLLINDLNSSAIRQALKQLQPNQNFVPLSTSALARSRADWLYGLNMTRAYTLRGQHAGYQGVLSVGRVQTPLLGLVVRRDLAISDFSSTAYYQVQAEITTPAAETFTAQWQPSSACEPYQDSEGRVILQALAAKVQQAIKGQPAEVISLQKQHKKQSAPLPYSLSALQIDAARAFGLTAQQVLDSCQQLYERHKLITYPRSDCRYLPQAHHNEGAKISQAIASNMPALAPAAAGVNLQLKSKAWDDTKVEAHHAIIPTAKTSAAQRLSATEQKLYSLIARQYLMQFYPAHCFTDTRVELRIAGGCFVAKARQQTAAGWKALLPKAAEAGRGDGVTAGVNDPALLPVLPALKVGQLLRCSNSLLQEKQTQPPAPFTDASLLSAMTGIARYVQDPQIKRILKDTDGLGTEATRSGIIELLFKRQFLQREGKQIRATAAGKALIAALPAEASLPDMTARWEAGLNAICQREQSYQAFMQPLTENLQQLISQAKQVVPQGLGNGQQKKWRRKANNKRTASKAAVDGLAKRPYRGKANKKAAAGDTGAAAETV